MSFKTYLVTYIGAPRNHHEIFVETASDESGYMFQVSGDIQNGMYFNHKSAKKTEESASFVSREYLGTVSKAKYAQVESTAEGIEPP
jgi:hypothetical protein